MWVATAAPVLSISSGNISYGNGADKVAVIGGLIRKEKVESRRGIPISMDIPILGWLFSKAEESDLNTEFTFLLSPTVYLALQVAPRGIFDPTKSNK